MNFPSRFATVIVSVADGEVVSTEVRDAATGRVISFQAEGKRAIDHACEVTAYAGAQPPSVIRYPSGAVAHRPLQILPA